jgi:DNA-binding transcriptional LysR family regulator
VEVEGFRADDYEAVKALAVLGGGIVWLPDFLAGDAVEAGTLVRVLPQWQPKKRGSGTFYFVYVGRRHALPKVEGFIQTALEQRNLPHGQLASF